jgi:hypothetical protein
MNLGGVGLGLMSGWLLYIIIFLILIELLEKKYSEKIFNRNAVNFLSRFLYFYLNRLLKFYLIWLLYRLIKITDQQSYDVNIYSNNKFAEEEDAKYFVIF